MITLTANPASVAAPGSFSLGEITQRVGSGVPLGVGGVPRFFPFGHPPFFALRRAALALASEVARPPRRPSACAALFIDGGAKRGHRGIDFGLGGESHRCCELCVCRLEDEARIAPIGRVALRPDSDRLRAIDRADDSLDRSSIDADMAVDEGDGRAGEDGRRGCVHLDFRSVVSLPVRDFAGGVDLRGAALVESDDAESIAVSGIEFDHYFISGCGAHCFFGLLVGLISFDGGENSEALGYCKEKVKILLGGGGGSETSPRHSAKKNK